MVIMQTPKNDNNSFAPYKSEGNTEVELVVLNQYVKRAEAKVDVSLDNGNWKTDPVGFKKLVDSYLKLKEDFEELKKTVDKS
jgi:hypothetical protein